MTIIDCLLYLSFFIISFLFGMVCYANKNHRIDDALYRISENERSADSTPPTPCQNLIELTFAKTGTLLSAQLSLADTLYASCDMVADILGCSASLLTLTDNNTEDLTVASSYGLNNPPAALPRTRSLSGRVLACGHALADNAPNEHDDLYLPPFVFSHVTSLISAPLLSGDTILGTLEIYSVDGKHFTARDLQLLSALARNAGTAIENARRYESTKLQLEEEKVLSELAQIGATTLDPEALLSVSADCIARALSANRCLGALAQTPSDTYRFIGQPSDISVHETVLAAVLATDEPTLLDTTAISWDTAFHTCEHTLLLPLKNDQEPLGFLLCTLPSATFTRYPFGIC